MDYKEVKQEVKQEVNSSPCAYLRSMENITMTKPISTPLRIFVVKYLLCAMAYIRDYVLLHNSCPNLQFTTFR